MPTSYTPAAVSSLATTATSMAVNTPLPMSDDSDEFESPAESPSQLAEYSWHGSSTPPRFQLDEDVEMKVSEEKPPEVRDDAGTEDGHRTVDQSLEEEGDEEREIPDGHRTVDQSLEDDGDVEMPELSEGPPKVERKLLQESLTSTSVQSGDTPPTTTTGSTSTGITTTAGTPKTHMSSQPVMKGLLEKLTRDSIVSLNITPLKERSEGSVYAKATPPIRTSSPSAEPSRFFSPIPMLSELVESKKEKLMKSLEEAKKRHAASVTLHQPNKQTYFSPTMVKHTTDSGESSKVTPAPIGEHYSFTPPKEVHVEQKSADVTATDFDSVNTFVFSPPMTRSATRRIREKSEERVGPAVDQTTTKKRGRGRYVL